MSRPSQNDDSPPTNKHLRTSASVGSLDPISIAELQKQQKDAIHRDYNDMKASFDMIGWLYQLKKENPDDYLDFSAAKPLSGPTKTIHDVDISIYKDIDWGKTPEINAFLINSLKRYFGSCSITSNEDNSVIAINSIFTLITKCYDTLKKQHEDGFEVLIPSPTFGYYVRQCENKGIEAKLIDTSENSYKLTAKTLDEAISKSKKKVVFLFTNPVNPTGIVYTDEEVREFSNTLEKHKNKVILAISDEVFKDVVMDKEVARKGGATSLGKYYHNTVTCNALSKSYGYESVGSFAIGPKHIIRTIEAPDFKLSDSAQIKIALSLVRSYNDAAILLEQLSQTYGFDKFRFSYEGGNGFLLEPIQGFKLSNKEEELLSGYQENLNELSDENKTIFNNLKQKKALLKNKYDKLNDSDKKKNNDYEALSPEEKEQRYVQALNDFKEENLKYFANNVEKCKAKITLIKECVKSLNEELQNSFKNFEIKAEIPNPQAASVFLIDFSSLKGTTWHKKSQDQNSQTQLNSDLDIVKFLAKEAKVIMMPGKSYGIDSDKMIIRMSVSHEDKKIKSAFKAIQNAISQNLTKDINQEQSQHSTQRLSQESYSQEEKHTSQPSFTVVQASQEQLEQPQSTKQK